MKQTIIKALAPLTVGALLVSAASAASTLVISANAADGNVRNDGVFANGTSIELIVGRAGTNGAAFNRAALFPFQLPDYGNVTNPFTSTTFRYTLSSFGTVVPTANVDLYGLAARTSPALVASDGYGETTDLDPNPSAFFLADNVVVPTTPVGTTIDTSNPALLTFLNAQYNGGVGANKYVFLRLNNDAATNSNQGRFNFGASENATAANNPALTLVSNFDPIPEPGVPALLGVVGILTLLRRRK